MADAPILSLLGSCRVNLPGRWLESTGRARLNQQNIFGFVHNSREVLQQLKLMTGATVLPPRLRPFLGVPDDWTWRPNSVENTIAYKFGRTDCFVVEISSIRMLKFKALYLQLNNTRELLASGATTEAWWTALLRQGTSAEPYPSTDAPPLHREVADQLHCAEQSETELLRDLIAIRDLLPRPVLFLTHFRVAEDGKPIRQREKLAQAFRSAADGAGVAFLDPTDLVLAAGPQAALEDNAHYRPDFLPTVGGAIVDRVNELLSACPAFRGSSELLELLE